MTRTTIGSPSGKSRPLHRVRLLVPLALAPTAVTAAAAATSGPDPTATPHAAATQTAGVRLEPRCTLMRARSPTEGRSPIVLEQRGGAWSLLRCQR